MALWDYAGEDMRQLKILLARFDPVAAAKEQIDAFLRCAAQAAIVSGALRDIPLPSFVVEQPSDPKNGDFSTNLALVSAKVFGMPPRKIAEEIVRHAPAFEAAAAVEVAGPGFINLYLAPLWFSSVLIAAVAQGQEYGRTAYGRGEKVNVEFVSANPTGPMHLGNARGGALGDSLAETLAWAGYEVAREFYINDAGNQIAKFGHSLAARYRQIIYGEEAVAFPEDGYQGEDIRRRAQEFYDMQADAYAEADEGVCEAALVDYALPRNVQSLKNDLEAYRVRYDVWFSEKTLHGSGAVQAALDRLESRGATYRKEGAVWYRATAYGGEKDEVLVRANGVPTYFAADIAYHMNKLERGFTTLIDVWGADHHGHVARMKGALDALGYSGAQLDIVLMQFVRLISGGVPVKMSKRTGKAITLTSLLDEVPIDSARFFFNMREPGSAIEFDLDLAVAQDSENPVYYVQYAHARICSILQMLQQQGIVFEPGAAFANLALLQSGAERELIRSIAAFPGEIVSAAAGRDPARITRYLIELATAFHRFYTACRIKGEENALLQARLALAVAAKTVLANGLGILKVSAPTTM